MEIICPKCNSTYDIPDSKVPNHQFSMKCKKCEYKILVNPVRKDMFPAENVNSSEEPIFPVPAKEDNTNKFREYKVMYIAEGGCGTILLGASGIPIKKMEVALNEAAADGWQIVFQVIEQKRFLLFWKREAIIITLGK